MSFEMRICALTCILILSLDVRLEAITVNPLCPTNKIAPRRRSNSDQIRGRTFGAFYDLLAPNNFQNDAPLNDLQEKPQEDNTDDCGEIEDYDENDLSSITSQAQRRKGARNSVAFFGDLFSNSFFGPIQKPPVTFRPQKPLNPATRPPYWSGGFFGGHPYRPSIQQNPSDYIKPVHENNKPDQATYRPHIVGGPLGHIVGFSTARTTTDANQKTKLVRTPRYYFDDTTPTPSISRTRRPISGNEKTIFSSFVDLFFK